MTVTGVTIQTKPIAAIVFMAVIMAAFATINLVFTPTPFAERDRRIEEAFIQSLSLPDNARRAAQSGLLEQEQNVLSRIPSEPFAWARLAYLQQTVQGDEKAAFAALRMSDLVSPNEPRQKMERALMWYDLRSVETAEQQAYQVRLWQKVIAMPNTSTWDDLKQNGLVARAESILRTTNPDLYSQLVNRK